MHRPHIRGGKKHCGKDEFTAALLNHAANVLGVNYVSGTPSDFVSICVNDVDTVNTDILSRESVFGVNDKGLIPLLIKAGDLAESCDASLRYYQRAYDVLKANHSDAEQFTLHGDICIAGYADLGTRLFRLGHFDPAEKMFAAAASLSRARAERRPAAVSLSPGASRQLRHVLREWQSAARDVPGRSPTGAADVRAGPPRRDAESQTEPLLSLNAASFSAPAPHGLRSASDLEGLVAYVFNEENVRESIETMLLARERYPELAVAPGSNTSPFTELRGSIDYEAAQIGRTPRRAVAESFL